MTHTPPIIGFTGPIGCGKDTAGRFLTDIGFVRVSFADVLRDCLYALNPLVPLEDGSHERVRDLVDRAGWETAKRSTGEIRVLLQRFGVEAGRDILGENVWVDAAFGRAPDGVPIVVTDVRFPNEAKAVQARGGAVVRITRSAGHREPGAAHISETAMEGHPIDFTICNDGTLDMLRESVMDVVRSAGVIADRERRHETQGDAVSDPAGTR